ncbi:glycoside hydrolase family 3 protein [Sulfurimonas sp. SAG-AH-194-I05]|nr:glycoside hydrolase family 3 N-terminal domain-containing protein [Sulfurimonas sp. SAG-AH-194-I05]MDF1874836.1 glycoside hydrolase family 3 protein [Sulfurimonas sp. SAG-AH-194-I05]
MKLLLLFLFSLTLSFANTPINDVQLKKMIGHMLIVGFDDSHVDKESEIIQKINEYELGGVILFDIFYTDRSKTKNISSPQQLQKLTAALKVLSNAPLLISVDQEGGKVARLKPKYGFEAFPSAKKVADNSFYNARRTYKKMSHMLEENGINCNFAPVVDMAVNKKNKVIYGLERSFGKSNINITTYANIQISEQKKSNIISVLKHFPGHGSSLGDSHLGFVDISGTWDEEELQPYRHLIKTSQIDMIMTAHVFNAHLDKKYPATLSYKVNTKLLRDQMGFNGVVVSDDLQMKAISKHYTLKETVTLAINAGVDMLLFGNQLGHQNIDELVNTILIEVKNGAIPLQRIIQANARISQLHE